ncbi:thiamine biosynthesis lipoprotein [Catalinimonas alkaloidigena]|uniref:FAD:protein FMN transferase n=1 Tax=Catalinimonas alkaloidigena TaxID=1075417 RepID=UPI0024059BA3|nr:FAD:protein FMN transferase [Catalinimonas alkaloidigena]MDF9800132.1 thiamine biosynthesis lipoprotein [Catalinimonas alkaloidigena]
MNSYQKKNIIYSIVLLGLVGIVWLFRQSGDGSAEASPQISFSGQTMGTVYNIKYLDEEQRSFKSEVDSLLEIFNASLNHYLPESEISRFNRADSISMDTLYFELPYFYPVLQKSQEIVEATDGAFDPTVAPLVNAWGFGPERGDLPDSAQVDSLLNLVGFDKIQFTQEYVTKTEPEVQLNFSAVAKGYGVDIIADFLSSKGIENMMVDIGGEIVCKGVNSRGETWRIGIDDPAQSGNMTHALVIDNQAIATSGDYRNFYMRDGKKYSHTINPKTGYQVDHSVLSVSVVADNCVTADAYATAFMVMGLEASKKVLAAHPSLDALIIYDDMGTTKTFQTQGVEENLLEL